MLTLSFHPPLSLQLDLPFPPPPFQAPLSRSFMDTRQLVRLSTVSRRWHKVCYESITDVHVRLTKIPPKILSLLKGLNSIRVVDFYVCKTEERTPAISQVQRLQCFNALETNLSKNFFKILPTLSNLRTFLFRIPRSVVWSPPKFCISFPTSLTDLTIYENRSSSRLFNSVLLDLRLPLLLELDIGATFTIQALSLPSLRSLSGTDVDWFLTSHPLILSTLHLHELSCHGHIFTDDEIRYLTDLRSLSCSDIYVTEDHYLPFLEHLDVSATVNTGRGSLMMPRLTSLNTNTSRFEPRDPQYSTTKWPGWCWADLIITKMSFLQHLRLRDVIFMIELPLMQNLTSLTLGRVTNLIELKQPSLIELEMYDVKSLTRLELEKLTRLFLWDKLNSLSSYHLPSLRTLSDNSHAIAVPACWKQLTALRCGLPQKQIINSIPETPLLEKLELGSSHYQDSGAYLSTMTTISSLRLSLSSGSKRGKSGKKMAEFCNWFGSQLALLPRLKVFSIQGDPGSLPGPMFRLLNNFLESRGLVWDRSMKRISE